jgi:acyl-CoA synthetase (AMP-forming)/AMP-acid ligase II
MNQIEDYLRYGAEHFPDRRFLTCDTTTLSYAEAWQQVVERAETLRGEGLRAGDAYPFRSSQSIDFLLTYFAIHYVHGVAVPLEESLPDDRYCALEQLLKESDIPHGTADVLFTTGTTGQSKGVMISHDAIIAEAENLSEAQGFTSELTFVIAGPLCHIGSLSKVYPTLLSGGALHIISGMRDMGTFFAAVEQSGARVASFLVPAALRMLMMLGRERLMRCADVLEFIETGAAPMAQSDMEMLCQILPRTRLYNTYASTETGIISTHNFNSAKCLAGCLGRPMKNSSFFISTEGTVACQGRTLMSGYVGDAKMTAAVLHDNTVYTHDNAMIDADGMLCLMGRSDDVINVGGINVSPSEVEDVAMSLPEIKECVCVAAHHVVMGNVLKLLVVLPDGEPLDKKRISRYIASKIGAAKTPLIYEQVAAVNRTFNGKIDRKSYR